MVVTHKAEDGVVRPVSAVQRGFLGLGRAVMVLPGWLPSPTWQLNSSLSSELDAYPGKIPPELGGGNGSSTWPLNGGARPTPGAATSDWLNKVAFLLCQEPVPEFIDKKRLCKGVSQLSPSDVVVKYDKKAYRKDRAKKKSLIMSWTIDRRALFRAPVIIVADYRPLPACASHGRCLYAPRAGRLSRATVPKEGSCCSLVRGGCGVVGWRDGRREGKDGWGGSRLRGGREWAPPARSSHRERRDGQGRR